VTFLNFESVINICNKCLKKIVISHNKYAGVYDVAVADPSLASIVDFGHLYSQHNPHSTLNGIGKDYAACRSSATAG
jgi:hypothetical protein